MRIVIIDFQYGQYESKVLEASILLFSLMKCRYNGPILDDRLKEKFLKP